jgi:phasin family protein
MATARTESTSSKKSAPSPSAATAKKAVDTAADAASNASQIIAERYKDTAYEALVGPNGENVSAALHAGEAVFAGMAEVSQEMMTFISDRLRRDLEAVEDLAQAKTPEEIFEKQCSIAKLAAEQYAAETSKLFALMARIQQSCWAPMEQSAKAALHGMTEATNGIAEAANGTGGKTAK